VNSDGAIDLITANLGTDTVSVLLGNGDGTFGPKTDFATGSDPRALALADLDRDGQLDLVVANTGANTISVLLGNGDGTFRSKNDILTAKGPHAVAVADLNGDARIDLVVANWWSNSVSVFLNTAPTRNVKTTGNGTGEVSPALAVQGAGGRLSLLTPSPNAVGSR